MLIEFHSFFPAEPIWVNSQYVTDLSSDNDGHTAIRLVNDMVYIVIEDIEEVIKKLESRNK